MTMTPESQIQAHLATLPEPKRIEMQALHDLIRAWMPKARLWFLDGKDEKGKVVSNPNIGYGAYTITYANGKTRDFYQIGLSANTTGLSVYIMGIEDKKHLSEKYGKTIGKASVTGYCIKFKTTKDIDLEVLRSAILCGIEQTSTAP